MQTLNNHPTKQEEIDYITGFVASLPRSSYLAAIMPELAACVTNAIRNDWLVTTYSELTNEKTRTQRELEELRKTIETERKTHEANTRAIETRAIRARNELEEIHAIAARLLKA
jgi:RPA family protein